MKILITGGCGFIGSNCINYFLKKHIDDDFKIINIDVLNYCASTKNIDETCTTTDNYKFIKGNINDIDLVKYILIEENITHIIHFAAQSHVDNSFDNSLMYTEDNVRGTHSLLEAVRITNKNIVFLHFSTDEVYGESLHTDTSIDAKRETSLLSPTNPYAASKAAAEMYVNAYRHSYGLNTIVTRCNNVYGPNQYPEKLIPKFIKLLKENKKCTIHGDGSSLRSFIHVNDVCSAVDFILQKGTIGEIYNIGSDDENEISVIDVTKTLVSLIKPDCCDATEWIEYISDRPFNDKRYFINCDKLKEIGWKQTISFKNGIINILPGK
jgi:dTDP-glucose 4,6-dehydratase